MTVLETLRDAVRAHPNSVAVDDGHVALSRGELYAAVLRLSASIAQVVAPGMPVGVYVESDALFAVAVFACAAAGSPCVPLDVRDPPAFAATIVERTRVAAIVETAARPFASTERADVLPRLPAEAALSGSFPATFDPSRALAAEAPFVLFPVPQSSGVMNAVVHGQRSLLSSARTYVDALELDTRDRILSISSQATFARLRDLLAALLGGALDFVRDPYSSMNSVLETLSDERITIVRAAPTVMRSLVRLKIDLSESATRVLRLEGEAVNAPDIERFRAVLPPQCRISVGFGSIETGTVAQWFVPAHFSGAIVGAGRVVPGTLIDVVKRDGERAVDGASGALCVRGPQTALGIWDGERVVPGPFTPAGDHPAVRAYNSADVIRHDAAGLIVHVGRTDRTRKVRGRRINLGFIEAAICGCRGVAAAAIIAVTRNETIRLAAFLVREAGLATASRDSVRNELRSRVPAHMIPGDVRFIDAIPLAPSGMPDTDVLLRLAAVPNPRRFFARTSGTVVPDDTARAVVQIWSDLLGTDSLLADQRWDDGGGDSLQLIEFAALLEHRIKRELPPGLLTADMRPGDLIERLARGAAHIGDDGDCRVVILFPGIRGDNEKLAAFRRQFAPGIRFIVPRYADWDEIVRRDASLALVLDEVVAQILPQLDGRPAVLVGHSFGGLIAHEVARRLIDLGHAVDLVGILDTDITFGPTSPAEEIVLSRSRAATFLHDVRALGIRRAVGLRAAYHMALRVYRSRPLRQAVARHFRRVPLPPEVAGPFDLFMMSFVREAVARAWRPQTNTVSTLVFRCKRQTSPTTAHDLGWSAYTTVVAVEEVGGTHLSMIAGPHGERLAESLQRALTTLSSVCAE